MDLEQEKARKNEQLANMRQGDMIIFLALIVVCIGWLVLTLFIPHRDKLTWPGALPSILLSLIIWLAGQCLWSIYLPNPEYRNIKKLFHRSLLVLQNIRAPFYRGILTIAFLIVYYFLLKYLPYLLPPPSSYLISTFLFIIVFALTFRAASIWTILLTTSFTTIALYGIFGIFYRIPLP